MKCDLLWHGFKGRRQDRALLSVALTLLPLLLCACAGADLDLNALNRRAQDLENNGRYADAADMLKKAVPGQPNNYWLRMKLAQDYLRSDRLELAKDQFQSAKKIDPKQAESYIEEGYADYRAGAIDSAEKSFSDLIAVDTSSFAGYHHLGTFMYLRGRPAEAERYLRASIERLKADPQSRTLDLVHSLMFLGIVVQQQGRLAEAEAIFREGLERSAELPEWRAVFLMNLGQAALRRGRPEEAERDYKQGFAVCADQTSVSAACADIDFTLVGFYAERERKLEAKGAADALFALPPKGFHGVDMWGVEGFAHKFNQLGSDCEKLGLDSEAQEAYRRVISFADLPPSNPWVKSAQRSLAGLSLHQASGGKADGKVSSQVSTP